MARYEHVREHYEDLRERSLPMLGWIAETAEKRASKGRLVLLENGWFCDSLNTTPFERLYEIKDSTTGEQFEFVRGDQCMLGKCDWESGMPIMAPTAWGTTSECLKDRLGQRCDGSHEHQILEGSNCYGRRSTQKAVWDHSVCVEIINGTIEEMQSRAEWAAYPAAVAA